MWLTRLSIQRPLIVLTVLGAVLIFGLAAWRTLGVELLPAVDVPVVTVTTSYPGAGPDAVDTLVTKKIEDAVANLSDIDTISSTSVDGLSVVTIAFTDHASPSSSEDVGSRVSAIRDQLPTDVKAPQISKWDANAQPVMQLSLSGGANSSTDSQATLGRLQQFAEDTLQKRLEATPGVAQVNIIGGLEREIQVRVDEQKLEAYGLSILQVNQALANDNMSVPAGSLSQLGQDWNVRLNTQVQTVADLQNILVARLPGGSVRVRDVATVVDSYKTASTIERTNGQPAVGLAIIKQGSANTLATTDQVRAQLATLQKQLPPDTHLDIGWDASSYISSSVGDVEGELGLAVVLTGLVLLLFLHTLRSTLIVLLAIPTSLIATLGVMALLGISLNFMSLLGLTLTVGILVDDSIVVLENIARHLHLGEDPSTAAVNGRSEIGKAAIAITLVDVVVFTPMALMTGSIGQYFRQFGLVIAAATLFSLLVSFTLTPLLASRWLKTSPAVMPARRSIFAKLTFAADAGYDRLHRLYARALRATLRFRWLAVGFAIASFVGGIMLVVTGVLSTDFMPADDSGMVHASLQLPAGSSLSVTDAETQVVEQRIQALPEVQTVFASVGVAGEASVGVPGDVSPNQANFAQLDIYLKSKPNRQRSSAEIATQIRGFGNDQPGLILKATAPSSLSANNAAPIQVRIEGEDQAALATMAMQVADLVRRVPGAIDVDDGGATGQPELVVAINRDRAADFGLTANDVAGVLRTGLAGTTVSTFRPDGTAGWDITVLLAASDTQRLDQIANIPVLTPSGANVRLGQLTTLTNVSGPTQVLRADRQHSVTVSADVSDRPAGDVVRDVQTQLDGIVAPAGVTISQGGVAKSQNEAFAQILQTIGISVLLMYVLMVLLFESVLYPLVIMLSLPLAVVGAFGLLALTHNTLNIMSMIGLILLTGLVGKNAILLVDFTNQLRRRGLERNAALLQAGPTRLRPILMTTSALILAMLPVASGLGDGGEWRAPLAVTVIGGLLTSTLLTLLVIPAAYTLMDDFQRVLISIPMRLRRRAPATDDLAVPELGRPPRRLILVGDIGVAAEEVSPAA